MNTVSQIAALVCAPYVRQRTDLKVGKIKIDMADAFSK